MPNCKRKLLTNLLIEGKIIIPFANNKFIIEHVLFYSNKLDVGYALKEYFTKTWQQHQYRKATRILKFKRELFIEEERKD
jgi:hypothetical protein